MQLELQPWMTERSTRRVLRALAKGGAAARFVGGAVRDALLGRPVADVDIATPAPPERVLALLADAGIKAVPTGLAHGTITAVARPRHFEITTLRVDVEPLGRRARVAFTDDWRGDALRRDFTINALFLDPDGRIHDYVGGLADLRAGRVRFVGDPETRIREDVLRLLRFYRFQAQLGLKRADPEARAACRALAPLLRTLSAERVWSELRKLLSAPDPLPALRLMQRDGVLAHVLPEARRFQRLRSLLAVEPMPDSMLRLGALIDIDAEGAVVLARRLRFSNVERDRIVAMVAPSWPVRLDDNTRARRRALYHLGNRHYRDLVLLRAAERGAPARRRLRALLAFADRTTLPTFPIRGRDIVQAGVTPGPRVKELLDELTAWWEARDFRPSCAQCLTQLGRALGAEQKRR